MTAHRLTRVAALALVALGAAACSSTAASSATTGHGAQAQIKSNFESFFRGSNGYSTKMSLLENSYLFSNVMQAQSNYFLARHAHVVVTAVGPIHGKTAAVRYNLYEGNKIALRNQSGDAVRVTGTWKVAASTVCGLLTLEGYARDANYGCPGTPATGTT